MNNFSSDNISPESLRQRLYKAAAENVDFQTLSCYNLIDIDFYGKLTLNRY